MLSIKFLRPSRVVPAVVAVAALAAPSAALAAHNMQIGVADDGKLFGSAGSIHALIRDWQSAGVQVVRLTAPWAGIAPNARKFSPPRGFGADPFDRRWDFTFMNRAMHALEAAHIKVQIALAGPAPWWASASPRRRDGRWLPSPQRYAQFAAAVASRYPGQVDAFILWNEPNEPVGLKPQRSAPDRYRDMVNAASAAIRAHYASPQILLGALASTDLTAGGNHHEGTPPLTFLRRMACVSERYRVIRGGACRHYTAPAGGGIVLHPHGIKTPPTRRSSNPNYATIGDLGRFIGVVDRLTRMHRLRVIGARRFPIYLAEFGYQTNPPDRGTGVSWGTQALWLAQGSQIAWRNPRVVDLNWYVWQDERQRGGWKSGLYTTSHRRKPSRTAYALPFLASRRSVWGQVRAGGAHTVTIQGRGRRGGWRNLSTFRTDPWGGFQRRVRVPRNVVLLRARADGHGPLSLAQRV